MLWLVAFLQCCVAMHYYAAAGSRTCFYRELTAHTVLTGRFGVEILDAALALYVAPVDREHTGVMIDVEEVFHDRRVVHQRAPAAGVFTFSALELGEHRVCLTAKLFGRRAPLVPPAARDPRFTRVRVAVLLDVRDGAFWDAPGHTAQLVLRVNALNDKLTDIRREQAFIRAKELAFRDQSERTCATVLRWLAVQAGALLLTCVYQAVAVARFFRRQKRKSD